MKRSAARLVVVLVVVAALGGLAWYFLGARRSQRPTRPPVEPDRTELPAAPTDSPPTHAATSEAASAASASVDEVVALGEQEVLDKLTTISERLLSPGEVEKCEQIVRSGLASDDPGVREAAALAIGDFFAKSHENQLLRLLSDNDPGVRYAAARALMRIGSERGANVWQRELRNRRTGGAAAEARVVGELEDESRADFLAELLDREEPDARLAALEALGRIATADTVALLDGQRTQSEAEELVRTAALLRACLDLEPGRVLGHDFDALWNMDEAEVSRATKEAVLRQLVGCSPLARSQSFPHAYKLVLCHFMNDG